MLLGQPDTEWTKRFAEALMRLDLTVSFGDGLATAARAWSSLALLAPEDAAGHIFAAQRATKERPAGK